MRRMRREKGLCEGRGERIGNINERRERKDRERGREERIGYIKGRRERE